MEKSIKKITEYINETLGNETHYMFIANDGKSFVSTVNGSSSEIAKAIFYIMHDQKNSLCKVLYEIIKLIVLNLISNDSYYLGDLAESMSRMEAQKSIQEDENIIAMRTKNTLES